MKNSRKKYLNNAEIRARLDDSRIWYWQLADELQIAPYTLSLWLRHEVSPDRKAQIMEAIDRLIEKKRQEQEGGAENAGNDTDRD